MNDLPQAPLKPEALHYLGAIKVRLESLYELLPDDPRLREHISDELDWIEGEIERISAAPLPRISDESAGVRAALEDIVSWKHDVLGERGANIDSELTKAFDRGARMAFYRCADRAARALLQTESKT